jgi:hypothetical protein
MRRALRQIRLLTFIALTFVLGKAHAAIPAWDGEYSYYASYGESSGGSVIQEEFTVKIAESKPESCEIDIYGYQTNEEIICITKAEGDSVTLLFKSYKSGDVKNMYDVAIYQPNQPLLKFERTTKNGKQILLTHWLGMTGLDDKKKKPGVYFKPAGKQP